VSHFLQTVSYLRNRRDIVFTLSGITLIIIGYKKLKHEKTNIFSIILSIVFFIIYSFILSILILRKDILEQLIHTDNGTLLLLRAVNILLYITYIIMFNSTKTFPLFISGLIIISVFSFSNDNTYNYLLIPALLIITYKHFIQSKPDIQTPVNSTE
jgi:hypothetical protein